MVVFCGCLHHRYTAPWHSELGCGPRIERITKSARGCAAQFVFGTSGGLPGLCADQPIGLIRKRWLL